MRRRLFLKNNGITGEYLTITALEDGLTVSLSTNSCKYSINGKSWKNLDAGAVTDAIDTGSFIYFKISNPTISNTTGIGTFTINKKCTLSGNCLSMLYGDKATSNFSVPKYAFIKLFQNCTTITNLSKNFLPATSINARCYEYMFDGCSSLVEMCELPAATLADKCYQYMFRKCTSLTKTYDLPAKTMEDSCYRGMFTGCTSLKIAPKINATSIAIAWDVCYGMFSGCTSLIEAPPILHPTTLGPYCYASMFAGCTSLVNVPELPSTSLESYCYYGMFKNCTSLVNAPNLTASKLAYACYYDIFSGCSNLNKITMLAIDIPANSNCLRDWVKGVSDTGTFIKSSNMTSLPTGTSGIPSGWTVQNT